MSGSPAETAAAERLHDYHTVAGTFPAPVFALHFQPESAERAETSAQNAENENENRTLMNTDFVAAVAAAADAAGHWKSRGKSWEF